MVIVETNGAAPSPGTAVDALCSQRTRTRYPASTRYAALVPASHLDAALRIPEGIRTSLLIDVYLVAEQGRVDTGWAAPRREHAGGDVPAV